MKNFKKILVVSGLSWLRRLSLAGLTFGLGLLTFNVTRLAFKRLAHSAHRDSAKAIALNKAFSSHSWRDFATLAELATLRGAEGTVSPYEIEYLINACQSDWLSRENCASDQFSLAHYWRKLGVAVVSYEKSLPPASPEPSFSTCSSECETELAALNLDAHPDTEAVLRIYDGYSGTYAFLFFRRNRAQAARLEKGANPKWDFLGLISNSWHRYAPPKYRVFVQGREKYFLIERLMASGSGFGMYREDIYQIALQEAKVAPQFLGSYYAKGHDSKGLDGGFQFSSTLLRLERHGTDVIPYLRYDFAYSLYSNDSDSIAITAQRAARVVAEMHEILTAQGYRKMAFQMQEPGDAEDFFAHVADFLRLDNHATLIAVARSGSEKQKEQVRNLVNTFSYSKHVQKNAAQFSAALR